MDSSENVVSLGFRSARVIRSTFGVRFVLFSYTME